jgi:hypothetical protein
MHSRAKDVSVPGLHVQCPTRIGPMSDPSRTLEYVSRRLLLAPSARPATGPLMALTSPGLHASNLSL